METIIPYSADKNSINILVQWDKGVQIYFYDKVFETNHSIHLFTNNMKEAMVIETSLDSNGILSAKLPDDLLSLGSCIVGYICTFDGTEFRSMYRFIIPVRRKPKPADYIHTDSDEYFIFEEKIKELEGIASNVQDISDITKGYVDQAKKSEENASNYAKQSQEYANNSLNYSNNAKASEDNAKVSEQNAKVSEDNAKTSETNAKAYEDTIKEYQKTLIELIENNNGLTTITKEEIDIIIMSLN